LFVFIFQPNTGFVKCFFVNQIGRLIFTDDSQQQNGRTRRTPSNSNLF
jgi:hypothetical protein